MIEPPIDERYEQAAVKESLTTGERLAAEETYTMRAFDYENNPIGSRDWTLFWSGWCAREIQAQQVPDGVAELIAAAKMAVEMIETEKHERRHVRWALKDAVAKVEAMLAAAKEEGT